MSQIVTPLICVIEHVYDFMCNAHLVPSLAGKRLSVERPVKLEGLAGMYCFYYWPKQVYRQVVFDRIASRHPGTTWLVGLGGKSIDNRRLCPTQRLTSCTSVAINNHGEMSV